MVEHLCAAQAPGNGLRPYPVFMRTWFKVIFQPTAQTGCGRRAAPNITTPKASCIFTRSKMFSLARSSDVLHSDRDLSFRSRKSVFAMQPNWLVESKDRIGGAGNNATTELFFSIPQKQRRTISRGRPTRVSYRACHLE